MNNPKRAVIREDLDRENILHPYSSLRHQAEKDVLVVNKTQGVYLYDQKGNEYLDGGAGLWCCNVGYGRQELADVAAKQMLNTSYSHSFNNFSNEPVIELSEKILRLYPDASMSRIFFGVSGSDANDSQIKMVRRYNNIRGKPLKKKIISRWGAYHGSTIGSGSLSGLQVVHNNFDLPIDGILHTHCPDYYRRPANIDSEEQFSRYMADELDRQIQAEGPETVAAFIAEPVCGSGGVFLPPAGYFREIRKVLNKHDVLMIADEVITAFGRTGSWFASPKYGVEPDLITVSKGITSGYFPLSACLISRRVADVLYSEEEGNLFGHGYTSSGHPVGAAVALENLNIIEREGLLANSAGVGQYLLSAVKSELTDHELVGDIRGDGLMIGIEFDKDKGRRLPFEDPLTVGSLLSKACLDEKLIVRGGHGRVLIALAPPLVLTRLQADDIVARLVRALETFTQEVKSKGFLE